MSKLGWMEPTYYGYIDGQPVYALSHEQFRKVIEGYACPRCLQEFTVILTRCTVCQLDLLRARDTMVSEYPQDWLPSPDSGIELRRE